MTKRLSKRIGITMRVVEEKSYEETRDALSHDWPRFLSRVLPEVKWMPIPNAGDSVVKMVEGWDLDGLIISGGGNIGKNPQRDKTEEILFSWAIKKGFPVLGVCRGMQYLCIYYGASLDFVNPDVHIAKSHYVKWADPPVDLKGTSIVNSYHNMGIKDLPPHSPLRVIARGPNGFIESIWSSEPRLLGMIWHPEREDPFREHDFQLIRWVFGY